MKLVRTLSIVIAMAASGTAFAAPDAKSPPPAPAPTGDTVSDADVAPFLNFIDHLADVILADKSKCPQMTTDINAQIDGNKDLLAKARAAKQSGKTLSPASKDHVIAAMKRMMPGMMTCKDDKNVMAALGRLEMK